VVKVILELYVAFSLSSFKSSPMLSMLLSVEELELLVIPYCHVLENHIHFLAFVNSVVPQLLLIIIKPWFQSFVISSSSTSIPSLSLPHLPQFFYFLQNRTYWNTPPSWSSWNYLSNEPSYIWNGFRTRELCLFYSGDAICPRLISDCATLNVFAISPCTGLQNWWFLMRWKEGLKELLNIKFSSIVHLWTCAQILMETANSLSSLVDDKWSWLQLVKNSWEHFVMPAKQIKCTIYPRGNGRE
jgi:hypothetical protein